MNNVKLIAIIIDHKHAPSSVIGELEGKVDHAYDTLYPYADELVILATCNRFEVYAITNTPKELEEKFREFARDYARYAYKLEGLEAVRHLFRVAAGLESAIIGENEILGQVAKAYEDARRRGLANKYMTILFHYAIKAGRLVRTSTNISRGNIGYPSAAVKLADEKHGIEGRRILVIGAGEAGSIIASLAAKKKPLKLMIANRTLDKAIALAKKVKGEAYPLSAIGKLLNESDIVFIAVTVDKPLITKHMLEEVKRRLIIIDISAKPAVELPAPENIEYYGFKDVELVVKRHVEQRRAEIPKAEAIIEDVLKSFERAWRRKMADDIIATFASYAETIMREEVEELLVRLRRYGVDGLAREAIEAFSKSLVKKLLRPLIVYTHTMAERGSIKELSELVEHFRREHEKRLSRRIF